MQNNTEPVGLMNVETNCIHQRPDIRLATFKGTNTVVLNNLLTNQVDDEDIDCLMDSFLDQFGDQGDCRIESIQVFQDSIHLLFAHGSTACNALEFFHNYKFKSQRIQASLLKDSDLFVQDFLSSDIDSEDSHSAKMFSDVDCEILVTSRQLKNYADSFNDKLSKELLGINTQVRYLCDDELPFESGEDHFKSLVENGRKKNLLYIIQIEQSCVDFNSINLIMLNQWKGASDVWAKKYAFSARINKFLSKKKNTITHNINMPLNKSLELLKQDYCDYIMYIKAKETAEMQLKSDDNIEIDTDYGIKKSILEYLHNELESDPMKQFSVKNIELLIVYLNRIKSKALQFANFENETNSEGNAYGEQDSDDCNLDNDSDNQNTETSNIKSLLDTDLTSSNPAPKPLMQPLFPSNQSQASSQSPKPLLPPQPLLQQQAQPTRHVIPPQPLLAPQFYPQNFPQMYQPLFNPANIRDIKDMPQLLPQIHQMTQSLLNSHHNLMQQNNNQQQQQQQPYNNHQANLSPQVQSAPRSLMSLTETSSRPSLMSVNTNQPNYYNQNANNNNNNSGNNHNNNYKRF